MRVDEQQQSAKNQNSASFKSRPIPKHQYPYLNAPHPQPFSRLREKGAKTNCTAYCRRSCEGRSPVSLPLKLPLKLPLPLTRFYVANDAKQKMEKESLVFERSEFQGFPIFCLAALGTRRAT